MKLKQALMSLILVGGSLALTLSYADQTKDKTHGSAKSAATKRVVVNGVTIPNARFELVTDAQIAQGHTAGPDLDRAVRENLIALEVISQHAVKEGLEKDPKLQAQIDIAREQILARAFQAHFVQTHPISDDVLHAEYNRMKAELGDKEYLVEHILVAKEDDAKTVIAELKKGADFEKIAKEKSIDTGSRDKGGKLDWATPVSFDKSFSDAMVHLKKGETTDTPVKTPFGYHVIRLIDVRPLKAPPFDEVKGRILQAKEQEAFNQLVQQMRAKAKVEER
ncbi:MAG: peptidyl-prolyl cis-trans isomerase [Betaproteobacteria bacterium]|nr:peptidyl-prolyl cis-trans isomerase [Betaproteobacteria bacterium]